MVLEALEDETIQPDVVSYCVIILSFVHDFQNIISIKETFLQDFFKNLENHMHIDVRSMFETLTTLYCVTRREIVISQ